MFITVSLSTSGNPVLINTDNILYMNKFGICTEFHFKNSSHTIVVREPFDVLWCIFGLFQRTNSGAAVGAASRPLCSAPAATGDRRMHVIDCKEILRSKYYRDDNYRGENRNG